MLTDGLPLRQLLAPRWAPRVILSWTLWIWMLVDCAVNEPSGNEKIVWILIILLANCVGAGIYLLVRRPKRKAETGA